MACECNIAAMFPGVGGYGIISATLRSNVDITITEGGMVLYGPATGDLSITAYAPLAEGQLDCPAKAGMSCTWDRRTSCETEGSIVTYLIPKGPVRSYTEGVVTSDISVNSVVSYETFSASASNGPTTIYLMNLHSDGWGFAYTGSPIHISEEDTKDYKEIDIFNEILPDGSKLYLQSFSWEYTPPNIPQVNYSFLFTKE